MSALDRRPVLVWTALVAATLASALLAHGDDPARGASVAVLVIACVKVRYVVLDFMELRGAPGPVRPLFHAWTIAVGAMLVTWYLVGVAS